MADKALIDVDNPILADLYRSILFDAGLPCRIEDKRSFLFGLGGQITIYVNESQHGEASELLRQTRPLWRKPRERLPACRRCDGPDVAFVNGKRRMFRPLAFATVLALVAPFLPEDLPINPWWLLMAALSSIVAILIAIARAPRVWHCRKCGNTMPQFSRFEIIEGGEGADTAARDVR